MGHGVLSQTSARELTLYGVQWALACFGLATPHQTISRRPSGYLIGTSMGCKSLSWCCLGQVFTRSTNQQGEKCTNSARALVPCGRSGVAPGRTNTIMTL